MWKQLETVPNLVDVRRNGLPADAHLGAVDGIAVLSERQPPDNHALLRRHHCKSISVSSEDMLSITDPQWPLINKHAHESAHVDWVLQWHGIYWRRAGTAPLRLDRVQPSIHAMSSRTLSELPWSCAHRYPLHARHNIMVLLYTQQESGASYGTVEWLFELRQLEAAHRAFLPVTHDLSQGAH